MKNIRYKIIKYLMQFIGIPQFSFCFQIILKVNDKEKYITIDIPSEENKSNYIKKLETANNLIKNSDIRNMDTLNIKELLTTGVISDNHYYYIKNLISIT